MAADVDQISLPITSSSSTRPKNPVVVPITRPVQVERSDTELVIVTGCQESLITHRSVRPTPAEEEAYAMSMEGTFMRGRRGGRAGLTHLEVIANSRVTEARVSKIV